MFQKTIKQIAIRAAVLLFFVMAAVGWGCGLSPGTCSSRALLGACAAYILVRTAGQLVIRVLISALVDAQIKRCQDRNQG
ncbi:MAG: hypothetical protein DRP56_01460 [Planctomycetota bacterium]|nr:hypothetical protein [Planctomycetota bacterium]RKY10241.1 MAG: hypothetical protein DRP56_01460 [Planctomycetota bacterium]RKY11181.1 MAG: hypothetical protein DRP52_06280 [Planctomycetota bacterium]